MKNFSLPLALLALALLPLQAAAADAAADAAANGLAEADDEVTMMVIEEDMQPEDIVRILALPDRPGESGRNSRQRDQDRSDAAPREQGAFGRSVAEDARHGGGSAVGAEASGQARQSAGSIARDAREAGRDARREAGDAARDAAQDARDDAAELAESLRDAAQEMREDTGRSVLEDLDLPEQAGGPN